MSDWKWDAAAFAEELRVAARKVLHEQEGSSGLAEKFLFAADQIEALEAKAERMAAHIEKLEKLAGLAPRRAKEALKDD